MVMVLERGKTAVKRCGGFVKQQTKVMAKRNFKLGPCTCSVKVPTKTLGRLTDGSILRQIIKVWTTMVIKKRFTIAVLQRADRDNLHAPQKVTIDDAGMNCPKIKR
jgi:hypothetical protein